MAQELADLKTGNNFDSLIAHLIQPMKEIFAENLYLEITAQDYKLEPRLQLLNNQIIQLSEQTQIPCTVTSNFHYIKQGDKIAFETALAIKDQKQISDSSRRKVSGNYYIMSEEEVREILQANGFDDKKIEELFDMNQKVCDSIDLILPKPSTPKFPLYKTPQEFVDLYAKAKDNLIQK